MRRYMERLRRDGELLVIERQVEARHELAVLTNIHGSRERLAGILGIAPDGFCRHWGRLAIDATAPFARRHEFERKRIPGIRAAVSAAPTAVL